MKLKKAIKIISEIRDLKDNWNGYGAKPISKGVINRALQLVVLMKPLPDMICPTANNSIQFEWENKLLYLEIEIFSDKIELFNTCTKNESLCIGGDL